MADNKNIEVGGRLHSIATGNVLAGANEILDDAKGKKQSVVNAENDIQLASHESRLNAYTEGKFVTVSNYSALPATGAVDTVYRVSSWDGTANNGQGAVDVTKHSEYAWQNGAYKFLDVKTQIGEVFDISEYNSGAVYTDLANALGNNGINVPSSIRRGGMSVKFKQVITPATYTIVKTEGATEQPTGTELQNDPGIISGTYTAGELSVFSTLPATINSSITYYLTVTETVDEQEVTTYTTWVITYAQSSDNKYVQYRLTTNEWSADIDDWSFCRDDVLIENPEYIKVVTGKNGKILYGVKTNGDFFFGAGCPQQIKDYIQSKIDELSLDEYEDIVAFLNNLEKGDKTLQTLLDEKVDKEDGKSLIPTQYIQETENSAFVDACTDDEDKLIEATTKEGVRVFFGDVDIKHDLTAKKIYSNKIYLADDELSPVSTVTVSTIISDPEERLEIKTDKKQKIISWRDEQGILHENIGIETKELKLSQVGLDLLSKDLKANWSDYISNDGENPLHLSTPKCARINLLTDFDLTKLSKKGYSVNSKAGINYDIPIEIEFWDMQGNYFKKKAFIGGQGDSTMAFDKKNIAIDLFDSEWDGDAFSIKFGDWVAQDSFHLKAYDYEPFVGAGVWSYKLFEQMMSVYSPEVDHIWKRALWDTTANTPTQASGSDLSESSEYNDTNARCFPDGFPVIVYQNGEFWGVFSFQLKKHRDNYHLSGSNPNHVFLDGYIGEGSLDANGNGDLIRWDFWEVRNPKNIVYAPFKIYSNSVTYKRGDAVTDSTRSKIYRSLIDENIGNSLSNTTYWKDCGEYTYKYDADVVQAEIAGNHDGSTTYDNWSDGSYDIGDIRRHSGHLYMNIVANNTKEPVYDKKNNSDSSPDFKNKTKCGWLNVTNTIKVKENIFAFTTIMAKIDAKESAYLNNPTAENLAALKAEFETYFDVQNLIDYIVITDVIRDDDAFWKNWLWTTYDGVKWWCNLYDCNISFGYGGAGTGGYYRNPAPFEWNGVQRHLCTYKRLQTGRSEFMLRYITEYYKDELNQYWIDLRNANIVEEGNIYKIAKDWIDSIGFNAYELENDKWGYVKHIDNMMRIYKWISQSVLGLDQLYGYFDNLYADFTIYRSTNKDYTIRCVDMKVSHLLSRQYSYIQGYVTRHESVVGGETVSTYSITGGAETDEDTTKIYTTVKDAIIAASSQPVDVPSSTLSYIKARCESIEYHRK